jgi:hypothetical protein
MNDSPIARGNNFNDKALKEEWYQFYEVHLANGKRVDSYDLIKKEIISRKAVDLESVGINTFESYLKEMKEKYAQKTKIRSDKYPELDGKSLSGKQVLELPESNLNFSELPEYIKLAKKYKIELRFRPE